MSNSTICSVTARARFRLVLVAGVLAGLLSGCSRGTPGAGQWRDAAEAGLEWMDAVAVVNETGTLYPDTPDASPANLTNPDLYHGQAGRAFGLLQAAAAFDEPRYHERALSALRSLRSSTDAARENGAIDAGLYSGLAGPGAALLAGARLYPEQSWLAEAALAIADTILAAARPMNGGATWNGVTDLISGAAGTGLFLLDAWRFSGRQRYRDTARAAADWLLETARPAGETLSWQVGARAGLHYPNFAHGTSGICFFLGELAIALGSDAGPYLTARRAGLAWLTAHGSAGGCVVFHHEGDGEDLQYVGWCHGPAGTSRAFLQERRLPGHPARTPLPAPALAGGDWLITQVGAEPGESPSGYWNNVSVCCGTAGILIAMLDLYLETGEERWLDHARACGRVLIEHGTPEGDGLKWPQAEHRVRPDFIQAQTGYMQGAAGIAAALTRLWLIETDRAERIVRLPDELPGPGRDGEGGAPRPGESP